MPDAPSPVSVDAAVARGVGQVYGRVVPLLFLAFVVPVVVLGLFASAGRGGFGVAAAFASGASIWCLAWTVWSILIPRWRLWAYRRVDDLDALKRQAVAAGLIWPEGHFFEKTEIVPAELRRELKRLEREHENRKAGVA